MAAHARVFATGAYVNFMADEGPDRVRESYRRNYERLVQIKEKYDPTNLFRLNQNIQAVVLHQNLSGDQRHQC